MLLQWKHLRVEISGVISHLMLVQGLFIVLPSVPEIENGSVWSVGGKWRGGCEGCGAVGSTIFTVSIPRH